MRFIGLKKDNEPFNRIYLKGHNVTILQNKEQLDLANSMVKPSFCTDCVLVIEDKLGLAYRVDYTEYSKHYCGCKGWD